MAEVCFFFSPLLSSRQRTVRVHISTVRFGLVDEKQKKEKKKKLLANRRESIGTGSSSAVSSATGSFFIQDHVPRIGKRPPRIGAKSLDGTE